MDKFKVDINNLRHVCDPDTLSFETTKQVKQLEGIIGQERAVKAMNFGLRLNNKGYNIYMAGLNGTGKTSYAKALIYNVASKGQVPNDICYVFNFKESDKPVVVELPPGIGEKFAEDMDGLVEAVKKVISETFAGEEFDNQRRVVRDRYQKDTSDLVYELDKVGREMGFVIRQGSKGLVSVPLIEGKPADQVDEELVTEEVTRKIQEKIPEMQKFLDEITRKIKILEKEASTELNSIEEELAKSVIEPEINVVREKYKDNTKIQCYLNNAEKDMLEQLGLFKTKDGSEQSLSLLMPQTGNQLSRYKVNVFVNNADQQGAPVVCETNPNYYNLFGKIEGKASLGEISTDFSMIKSGSIHKANGGYLIINAKDILKDAFAWDALKRTLKNQESVIENIGEQFKIFPTVTIKPEAVPINVKVILIGDSYIQQLLYSYEDDFSKLFKIIAPFDTSMERNADNINMFYQFVSSVCEQEKLKEFDKTAVARIIEFSSRLADHQQKLSTKFNETVEIVYEANAWAEMENSRIVTSEHIEKAIEEKINRANLFEEKVQESIISGQILIDIEGEAVGQINGLSVYNLGDYYFGKPSKITGNVFKGRRGLVNIEREVKLSGKIHDKGVLILSGYIGAKYGQKSPISIGASICFEQNYGGVDGDSASCAELVALLSAFTDTPIRQDLAITGSMNQKGQVQPIGGTNQKVEGFYRLCKERGLTGKQGVIIPKQNIINLMLDKELIEDCEAGKFHIYSISHVDEAIELLTGLSPEEFTERIQSKMGELSKSPETKQVEPDTKKSEKELLK